MTDLVDPTMVNLGLPLIHKKELDAEPYLLANHPEAIERFYRSVYRYMGGNLTYDFIPLAIDLGKQIQIDHKRNHLDLVQVMPSEATPKKAFEENMRPQQIGLLHNNPVMVNGQWRNIIQFLITTSVYGAEIHQYYEEKKDKNGVPGDNMLLAPVVPATEAPLVVPVICADNKVDIKGFTPF
ncbi:MAG TPA: hypothetical protein VGF14_03080 [Alphaproteobacteria bacterium]